MVEEREETIGTFDFTAPESQKSQTERVEGVRVKIDPSIGNLLHVSKQKMVY